jgi:hypothetical protein
MSVLRYCLDRRVLAALFLTGLAIALVAPQVLGRALPLLLVAACPLSMAAMAIAMNRGGSPSATPSSVDSIPAEPAELTRRQRRPRSELPATETKGEV